MRDLSDHPKIEEIYEALKSPDKKEVFLKTREKTYHLYFKNFDYYFLLIITNKIENEITFTGILPTKYVRSIKFDSLNELLQNFLKIVGIRTVDFSTKNHGVIFPGLHTQKQILLLHPNTYKNTIFFGCSDEKNPLVFSLFGVDVKKYQSFLKKYGVN